MAGARRSTTPPGRAAPAELGYGDGDEATVVELRAGRERTSTSPRTSAGTFTVANPATLAALTLRLVRDDGAVVYLNGTEIVRSNMPTGHDHLDDTCAVNNVGDAEESQWFTYPVNPALLVAGTNTLAVEIHQNNATSSDISLQPVARGARRTQAGPAPTALAVTGVTDTTASLQWTAPSGPAPRPATASTATARSSARRPTTSFTDTGLTSGQSYSYTVSAITDGVETAKAGPVVATTTTNPPPTALQVTGVTDTSVDLAWTAPAGAGTTTGYRVYRGVDARGLADRHELHRHRPHRRPVRRVLGERDHERHRDGPDPDGERDHDRRRGAERAHEPRGADRRRRPGRAHLDREHRQRRRSPGYDVLRGGAVIGSATRHHVHRHRR